MPSSTVHRLQAAAFAAACALACAQAARAQIYAGTGEGGSIVLSNHASDAAPTLLVAGDPVPRPVQVPPAAASAPAPVRPRAAPRDLAPEIRDAARRYALPEALLTAVVAVESGFDPKAVSRRGAKGLMQLMPATARRFGVRDVFAVRENLHGGAAYLRVLIDQFDNDVTLALAAYNAGEGAVLRAGRRLPDYPETRDYVARVLAQAPLR
ncbi:lytic transglycosylase domain-containing protein [Variovorax sp. YR752]|uniref:lytic transglycosylase domain-containing protein n=1 Tax=Variovorax sp. YR752 TaxID=1884383 RepID=UPI003138146C